MRVADAARADEPVAHALGFRAFQISLPSWQVPTDPEVVAYFESVCGAFPDSTFMHYNTARVGRLVSGETLVVS